MSLQSAGNRRAPFVESILNYLTPTAGKPYRYTYDPPAGDAPPRESIELRAFVFYPN